jgi:hypothetical protein
MKAFKVLKPFQWLDERGEPIADYIVDLVYAIKDDNARLAAMAEQWAAEGKVQLADDESELGARVAGAKGTATVT